MKLSNKDVWEKCGLKPLYRIVRGWVKCPQNRKGEESLLPLKKEECCTACSVRMLPSPGKGCFHAAGNSLRRRVSSSGDVHTGLLLFLKGDLKKYSSLSLSIYLSLKASQLLGLKVWWSRHLQESCHVRINKIESASDSRMDAPVTLGAGRDGDAQRRGTITGGERVRPERAGRGPRLSGWIIESKRAGFSCQEWKC